jgi:cytoskeletal protein CcmA (bactofilin family)
MLGKKDNGAIAGGGQTLNTIIGRGTLFEGTMKVENSVRVDGVFKGELKCSGALTISQSGEAYAHLEGKDIYINGIVRGIVHAEKVRLDSQARFIGEIYANALSVSEGAIFHGSCSMDIEENEDVQKLWPKDAKGKEIKKSVPEPKVQVVEN